MLEARFWISVTNPGLAPTMAGTGTPENARCPLPFQKGEARAEVPFNNSIISNFMVYHDRFEKNLLQLFAHLGN